jgi:DNA-binding NtrC family response regulator
MLQTDCRHTTPSWNLLAEIPRPATILVADDDAAVRQMMAKTLRRSGFSVIEADSAERGVAAVAMRQGAIDLAIIDMQMPGMSGLDLAVEVERRYPGIQLLYISGYLHSIALDCISRRAPESVLFKPFTVTVLLDKVAQLLGRDA